MAYLSIDDQAGDHPKLEVLTDAAFRLWFKGNCYCQRFLTDGFIPARVARALRGWSEETQAELTRVLPPFGGPLWHVDDDGNVRVHDYLDWNQSRDEVQKRRAVKKDRMKSWRDKRDAPQDAPRDISRDIPRDIPRDAPQDTLTREAQAKGVPRDALRDAPRAPAPIPIPNLTVAKATRGRAPLTARRNTQVLNDGDVVQCPAVLADEFQAVIGARLGEGEDAYLALLNWTHRVSEELVAEFGGAPAAFLESPFRAWKQRLAQDWAVTGKPAGPASCRGGHKPPCPDEVTCTRRRREDQQQRIRDEAARAEQEAQ